MAEAISGKDLQKIHWTVGLIVNILGYAAFFIPGYLIFGYVRGSSYSNESEGNCLTPIVKIFFLGSEHA